MVRTKVKTKTYTSRIAVLDRSGPGIGIHSGSAEVRLNRDKPGSRPIWNNVVSRMFTMRVA